MQTISIAAAFPFMLVMVVMMVAIVKAFAHDADTPNVGDSDFAQESESEVQIDDREEVLP